MTEDNIADDCKGKIVFDVDTLNILGDVIQEQGYSIVRNSFDGAVKKEVWTRGAEHIELRAYSVL